MLCPACGSENADDATLCTSCNEVLDDELAADVFGDDTDDNASVVAAAQVKPAKVAPVPSDDDHFVMAHTGQDPKGVIRNAVTKEIESPEHVLRADAVLGLVGGAVPDGLSPFEQHVAELIDGQRTVARIRSKSGLSSDDVRIALGMLRDRGALELLGLLERGDAPPPADDDAEFDDATDAGMDLAEIERQHGPASEARTDPDVPKEIVDELKEFIAKREGSDDDPSPFG
jgi:hypothetical protein